MPIVACRGLSSDRRDKLRTAEPKRLARKMAEKIGRSGRVRLMIIMVRANCVFLSDVYCAAIGQSCRVTVRLMDLAGVIIDRVTRLDELLLCCRKFLLIMIEEARRNCRSVSSDRYYTARMSDLCVPSFPIMSFTFFLGKELFNYAVIACLGETFRSKQDRDTFSVFLR